MAHDPAYLVFRRFLVASITETAAYWQRERPGAVISPDTLAGLAPRRLPLNRAGQMAISLDERLWQLGRDRYLAPGARR